MTYRRWDVVVAPYPFVDSPKVKRRPILVLSNSAFNRKNGHFIAAMITTTKHRKWQGDTEITDLGAVGLSTPSLVRFKIFTLDNRMVAYQIGSLSDRDKQRVQTRLTRIWAE